MQLSLEFQSKLKNPNVTFTTKELEDGMRLLMIDFIEQRVELHQLLEVSERLRRDYHPSLSKKFFVVVDTFHNLHKERNNSPKKHLTKEEIIYLVDNLLCEVT